MTSMQQTRNFLSRRPYIIAAIIFAFLVAWVASGGAQETDESELRQKPVIPMAKVQVKTFSSVPMNKEITLYGRTEPDRITTLKAEVKGRIEEILIAEGADIKKGQPIVRIAMNDLKERLAGAEALLVQRELEHKGALKLKNKGYQAETQLADRAAKLSQAIAEVKRLKLDIERTTILAPYDGVFNKRYVEEGDYVGIGDPIAMVADLTPLIVKADVNEANISQVELEQSAIARLVSGGMVDGHVRYISKVADEATNTFRIEVAIENEDGSVPAGISAELSIPLFEANAIKVSPALLALDEQGNIGVKTIEDETVVFTPIDIVKSEKDGVWLTGLGREADVIILGQGFVRAGDKVDPVYAD